MSVNTSFIILVLHKKTGDIRFCLKARRRDFLFISLEVLKNPDCVRCAISLKATFALACTGGSWSLPEWSRDRERRYRGKKQEKEKERIIKKREII